MSARTRYILDMPWPVAILAGLSALLFFGVIGLRVVYWPVTMPSGSMQPTVAIGDILVIDKFAYRGGAVPERGDVVAFRTIGGDARVFVKRVAGRPGDVVQMVEGVLHVNGAAMSGAVDEGEIVEDIRYDLGVIVRAVHERPRTGVNHVVWNRGEMPGDHTKPYEVPAGTLFMLGDDRDNSSDSRFEHDGFGYVPLREVVGRVRWRVNPDRGFVAVE